MEFHIPTFFLPAFHLPVITSHLMFDTGTRSHLFLSEDNARSHSLPEELALVHHYSAVYVAIYTQINLQRASVSSKCK